MKVPNLSMYKGDEPPWTEKAKDPKLGSFDHFIKVCGVITDPTNGHDCGKHFLSIEAGSVKVSVSWPDNAPLFFRSVNSEGLRITSPSKRDPSKRVTESVEGRKLTIFPTPTPVTNPMDQAYLLSKVFASKNAGSIVLVSEGGDLMSLKDVTQKSLGFDPKERVMSGVPV